MTRTIEPGDRDYPDDMALVTVAADWARPPPSLWIRGDLPRVPGVAIVGRRDPSPEASAFASELAAAVAAEGWSVWSGGANGIDAAAHQGALDAGGLTVAVLAGDLEAAPPPENRPLFERIVAAGGALLGLERPGTKPINYMFLRRNLVLAALTPATVVIEAGGYRSGALSMGRGALRIRRPTLVVPHPPWSVLGAGCALLLRRGAHPIASKEDAMQSLREILNHRRLPTGMRPPARAPDPYELNLDDDARAVLAALDAEGRHIDELCRATGLGAAEVNRALLALTLQGLSLRTNQGGHCRAP